ncbi:MAG: PilZ domain-containing protein [Phycisphaerae bacterium]
MLARGQIKNRRRHARSTQAGEVALFRFEDDNNRPVMIRSRLENVSACGASIRADRQPPIDAFGELRIHFKGFEFVAQARVVRHTQTGYALEFCDQADARSLDYFAEGAEFLS